MACYQLRSTDGALSTVLEDPRANEYILEYKDMT